MGKENLERFDHFVEDLLYNPEKGYYATRRVIGKDGDYYTASTTGVLFGYTFARYFMRIWKPPVPVLEIGAGEGHFAHDVISCFEKKGVDYRYLILEKSPAMRRRQEALLGSRARWIESLDEVEWFRGIIFHNELLDAIPFRRFKRKGGRWVELYVEDRSRFVEGPEVNLDILPEDAPDGVIYDVSIGALEFLRKQVEILREGYIIIVDYGYERDELLERFPGGSMTVYHKHTVGEDVFAHQYEQDITYFVDWTLIREWMESLGMELVEEKPQGKFLMDAGIMEVVEEVASGMGPLDVFKLGNAAKNLIFNFPNFRVQVWRKV